MANKYSACPSQSNLSSVIFRLAKRAYYQRSRRLLHLLRAGQVGRPSAHQRRPPRAAAHRPRASIGCGGAGVVRGHHAGRRHKLNEQIRSRQSGTSRGDSSSMEAYRRVMAAAGRRGSAGRRLFGRLHITGAAQSTVHLRANPFVRGVPRAAVTHAGSEDLATGREDVAEDVELRRQTLSTDAAPHLPMRWAWHAVSQVRVQRPDNSQDIDSSDRV